MSFLSVMMFKYVLKRRSRKEKTVKLSFITDTNSVRISVRVIQTMNGKAIVFYIFNPHENG